MDPPNVHRRLLMGWPVNGVITPNNHQSHLLAPTRTQSAAGSGGGRGGPDYKQC